MDRWVGECASGWIGVWMDCGVTCRLSHLCRCVVRMWRIPTTGTACEGAWRCRPLASSLPKLVCPFIPSHSSQGLTWRPSPGTHSSGNLGIGQWPRLVIKASKEFVPLEFPSQGLTWSPSPGTPASTSQSTWPLPWPTCTTASGLPSCTEPSPPPTSSSAST